MATANSTCTPPPCWGEYACDPIVLNPDIAGLGVISAYFASAVLAVLSICIAYMTHSLPETYYNDLDRSLIYNKSGHLRIWKGISKYPHPKRAKAFRQFVLVLSDQQLVTGICVIIGALVQSFQVTAADFNVVTTLAWFSSTVHLVTLIMLRDYFRAYPSRYISRVVFMVIVLVLLIFAILVSSLFDGYPGLPLLCLFPLSDRDYFSLIWIIPTIIWLTALFLSAILAITAGSGKLGKAALFSILQWFVDPEARALLKSFRVRDSFFAFVHSEIELRNTFTTRLFESFWLQIGIVVYLLAYGLKFFLSVYLWSPEDGRIEIPSDIGYGQILPMLLLVLPFLALFESIWDIREKFRRRNDAKEYGDRSSQDAKVSGNEYGASGNSIMSLTLEPALVRVNREFVLQENEIKRLFPLEYMALKEMAGVHLAQSKQTLLELLSKAKARQASTSIRFRYYGYTMAIMYILYSFFLGWFTYALQGQDFWAYISYLPVLLFVLISVLPYVIALCSLRQGAENKTKKRLLKLMRLVDRVAKEEESTSKAYRNTKANDADMTASIKFPLQRKWTL